MDIVDAAVNGLAAVTNPSDLNHLEITTINPATEKWPGWPGHCVFRLIVSVTKVGSIIGRKGELIKKMCEETRARICVLDSALGAPDRIVLISGKEELKSPCSPADVSIRVFKRVYRLSDNDADSKVVEESESAIAGTYNKNIEDWPRRGGANGSLRFEVKLKHAVVWKQPQLDIEKFERAKKERMTQGFFTWFGV